MDITFLSLSVLLCSSSCSATSSYTKGPTHDYTSLYPSQPATPETLHAGHQPHIQGAAAWEGRITKAKQAKAGRERRHQKELERRRAEGLSAGERCPHTAFPGLPGHFRGIDFRAESHISRCPSRTGPVSCVPLWFQGADPLSPPAPSPAPAPSVLPDRWPVCPDVISPPHEH